MACASQTLRVNNINYRGKNHTPISNTAMVKLGGPTSGDGVTDNSGKYFAATKVEPGEVEFEVAATRDFDADFYRGQCGDLMFLTDVGVQYLMTNASLSNTIEIKDGQAGVKLAFKGDQVVKY